MLAEIIAALGALASLVCAVVVWSACALAGRADADMEQVIARRHRWTED